MKKVLSVIMAILVLSTVFVFSASAACDCKDHTNDAKGCHCCPFCDNLDVHYLTSCLRGADGKLEDPVEFCCNECTGIRPCDCGCDCCALSDEEIADGEFDPILTPDQQEAVVDGFQRVLGLIRDFFDKLFNAIFEFLRFDEIMGTN